jgi:hypothetical protein
MTKIRFLIFICTVISFFSSPGFAYTQGDCSEILHKQEISPNYSWLRCWFGTSHKDVIRVSEGSVIVNGSVVGKYEPILVHMFFGFGGRDQIVGGSGMNFIFGMSGRDKMCGFGINYLIGGKNVDVNQVGFGDMDICEAGKNREDLISVFGIGALQTTALKEIITNQEIIDLLNLLNEDVYKDLDLEMLLKPNVVKT